MDLPIYINFQETRRKDGGGDYREGDIEERVFEGIILAKCHLQLLCVAGLLNQEKLQHIRGFFPNKIFRGFSLRGAAKTPRFACFNELKMTGAQSTDKVHYYVEENPGPFLRYPRQIP